MPPHVKAVPMMLVRVITGLVGGGVGGVDGGEGGTAGGDVSGLNFPTRYLVDYVRIYPLD